MNKLITITLLILLLAIPIINQDKDVESKDLKDSVLDGNKNIDNEDKGQ